MPETTAIQTATFLSKPASVDDYDPLDSDLAVIEITSERARTLLALMDAIHGTLLPLASGVTEVKLLADEFIIFRDFDDIVDLDNDPAHDDPAASVYTSLCAAVAAVMREVNDAPDVVLDITKIAADIDWSRFKTNPYIRDFWAVVSVDGVYYYAYSGEHKVTTGTITRAELEKVVALGP